MKLEMANWKGRTLRLTISHEIIAASSKQEMLLKGAWVRR